MTVRELNQQQLEELKYKVFYLDIEDEDEFSQYAESWSDDIQLEVEKAVYAQDIKDETIYKLFEHYNFVEEDFVSASLPESIELEICKNEYNDDYELENIINNKLVKYYGFYAHTYDYKVINNYVYLSNIIWSIE